MAGKRFDVSDKIQERLLHLSQKDIETSLHFIGLLYLTNSLKKDTITTIKALREADICCNMITGDHINTAISIACDCGLITVDKSDIVVVDAFTKGSEYEFKISNFESGEILTQPIFELFDSKTSLQSDHQGIDISQCNSSKENISNNILREIAITSSGLMQLLNTVPAKYIPDMLSRIKVFARMKPHDKEFIVKKLLMCESNQEAIKHVYRKLIEESSSLLQSRRRQNGQTFNRLVSETEEDVEMTLVSSPTSQSSSDIVKSSSSDFQVSSCVMFCGDGANDMSALRASTVGVSLCEAETSIAAPLTSQLQSPSAVIDTIKEGRCSLITAYVLVMFNLMYAVIQLFMACLMYRYGLRLGHFTYLVQDLFFTLALALAISRTAPSSNLGNKTPPERFFTSYFGFKLCSQMICFPIFQLIALKIMSNQEWYSKYQPDENNPLSNATAHENTVISIIGYFQVMIASVASTIGSPYRQSWYTNSYHWVCFAFQLPMILYIMFAKDNNIIHILEMKSLPYDFCIILLMIVVCNCIVSGLLMFVIEKWHIRSIKK
jgi:magnesium-transporting ATPase (P-type)